MYLRSTLGDLIVDLAKRTDSLEINPVKVVIAFVGAGAVLRFAAAREGKGGAPRNECRLFPCSNWSINRMRMMTLFLWGTGVRRDDGRRKCTGCSHEFYGGQVYEEMMEDGSVPAVHMSFTAKQKMVN